LAQKRGESRQRKRTANFFNDSQHLKGMFQIMKERDQKDKKKFS
jgi:hypothetical protein